MLSSTWLASGTTANFAASALPAAGRYYVKKYSDDMEIEEILTVRSDWKSEEFAKTVRSYLKKVTQFK